MTFLSLREDGASPLPHPTAQTVYGMGGRAGERAGTAPSVAKSVVAAAQAAVGVRFRLQGRDPAYGLDCVGVAAVALRAGGYSGPVPEGYALRTGVFDGDVCGLAACEGNRAGDLVLCRAGPGQLHLAVLTDGGFVHADAGLRRVVERPGVVPWPVVRAWRIDEGDDSWRR